MITIDESRVGHIFRDALGHFPDDTELSRQAMIDVANDPKNILGADHFGNTWAGTQIWVSSATAESQTVESIGFLGISISRHHHPFRPDQDLPNEQ
jgi:hypothetical protein